MHVGDDVRDVADDVTEHAHAGRHHKNGVDVSRSVRGVISPYPTDVSVVTHQ